MDGGDVEEIRLLVHTQPKLVTEPKEEARDTEMGLVDDQLKIKLNSQKTCSVRNLP